MPDLPRVNISYDADIYWVRLQKRTTNPDNANATDRWNFGIVNDNLVWVDSLGNVHTVASGAGAPANATYITQTANAGLTNEQALSSLSTGLMKVATGTGVITSVPWNGFYYNGGSATTLATYNGLGLTTAGSATSVTGVIPPHVTTISKAEWWFVLLSATGNEQYDSDIQYAAVDEAYTANTASVSNQSIVQTSNNDVYKVSVASLFSGVTANDVFGCRLTFDKINSGTLIIFGLYLEGA